MSKLYVVGIGPGNLNLMTFEAREAIEAADVVIGYKLYLELIESLLVGKEVVSSGMMKEVDRCAEAIAIAATGKSVALVSSGDAGIYGMAGLVLELAQDQQFSPEIVIVPGVSAVQAAAAVLGAPLMHDFAVISLSDLLTPWHAIEQRLVAAATTDFVIALYNPRSKGRVCQIETARSIFLAARAADTPVGIVRNACREGEERIVTTLEKMFDHSIDMFSIVIIGNASTFVDKDGRMVTPRGYKTGTINKEAGPDKTSSLFTLSNSPVGDPRSLMFCGTGSDVGKSVITAGYCRILKNRGLVVAPFKSQNMALNSDVTPEGGEIGRAQAVQAAACGIPAHVDMNPVLLKPNSDTGSQVILQGQVVRNMNVKEYNFYKPEAFVKIQESYARLHDQFDFIVIEGAGSIAEINLKSHDIANLRVAEMAGCPVILVADIERGGVFAQIVGTLDLLDPAERSMIKGVIINKFRGDPSLLNPGIDFVEKRTRVPVLGVVPYFNSFRIPNEDSVALAKRETESGKRKLDDGEINIGVVRLPKISNYTDFDTLEGEPGVNLHYVHSPEQLSGLDILILPGSKSTIADLYFLIEQNLYEAIQTFTGSIMGICGGYQMLGRRVLDPDGVESSIMETKGLGLLDVETVMLPDKETHQVIACLQDGGIKVAPGCDLELTGYEIHMGSTTLGNKVQPFARLISRSGITVKIEDGAITHDGRVFGTYMHGIFNNQAFRTALLNRLRREKGIEERSATESETDPFDQLAEHLEQHLDMAKLFAICGVI